MIKAIDLYKKYLEKDIGNFQNEYLKEKKKELKRT